MLLALAACDRGDPALDRYGKALHAWQDAQDATRRGDAPGAVVAMAKARAADPDSVPLAIAEASALAAAGRTQEAVDALGVVLRAHPEVGAAWYNRAAYRVRLGQDDGAAADLREALRRQVRTALETAADPDFAPVLSKPAFAAILPPQPILAEASGPSGAVFVGGDVEVRIRIAALPAAKLTLARDGAALDCLTLTAIVEDDTADGIRTLTLRFRGVAACNGTIGPFLVHDGTASVATAAVNIEVDAPSEFTPPMVPPLPTRFPIPGALAGDGWQAERLDGLVVALGRADRQIKGNGRKPDATLAWRVSGDTRAAGGLWMEDGVLELASEDWTRTIPAR